MMWDDVAPRKPKKTIKIMNKYRKYGTVKLLLIKKVRDDAPPLPSPGEVQSSSSQPPCPLPTM
jgi:hypothetical protein